MDKRLIDANALPNYKCQTTVEIRDRKGPTEWRFVFWEDIEKAPTIDAVEVVRCRECKERWETLMLNEGWVHCKKWGMPTKCDGFCHKGKRMDAKDMDVPTKDGGAEG